MLEQHMSSRLLHYAAYALLTGAISGAGLLVWWQELSVAADANHDVATIVFVGDTSFDRHIRLRAHEHGYRSLVEPIRDTLARADVAIANLEGPITPADSVSAGSRIGSKANMTFTNPTTTPSLLRYMNVDAVSLANNHTDDFGTWGLAQTRARLSLQGIGYFGGERRMRPFTISTDAGSVAVFGYNAVFGQRARNVADAVRDATRTHDVVAVFAHWGTEYDVEPSEEQRRAARLFADAGAELVVGAHPHVVQPHERIGTTDVYYSLGNFLFDQYFDRSVRRGAMLSATVRDGAIVGTATRSIRSCFSGHVIPAERACPDQ
jgi:poly-gamma-glutamate synthesis protein (capsule biosynthesis protein)